MCSVCRFIMLGRDSHPWKHSPLIIFELWFFAEFSLTLQPFIFYGRSFCTRNLSCLGNTWKIRLGQNWVESLESQTYHRERWEPHWPQLYRRNFAQNTCILQRLHVWRWETSVQSRREKYHGRTSLVLGYHFAPMLSWAQEIRPRGTATSFGHQRTPRSPSALLLSQDGLKNKIFLSKRNCKFLPRWRPRLPSIYYRHGYSAGRDYRSIESQTLPPISYGRLPRTRTLAEDRIVPWIFFAVHSYTPLCVRSGLSIFIVPVGPTRIPFRPLAFRGWPSCFHAIRGSGCPRASHDSWIVSPSRTSKFCGFWENLGAENIGAIKVLPSKKPRATIRLGKSHTEATWAPQILSLKARVA